MSRGAAQRSNDNFSVLLAIECYFQGVRRVVNIVSPVCTILVARRSAAFRVIVLRARRCITKSFDSVDAPLL